MRSVSLVAAGALALAALTVVDATVSTAHAAPADTAYALNGSSLLSFDIADPGDVTSTAITGVSAGESLVGLDVRPQNGQLYALGVNATTDTATLYVVHEQTGVAGTVGAAGTIAFTTDGATTVDLPDPATVGYGFDINPAADRIRVTAGSLNFRVNPNSGAPVDGNNGAGVVAGTNPDGSTNSGTTTIDGSAYTNNVPTTPNITTLYTLDAATNTLFIQNPANSGTQNFVHTVTLGGSTLDFTSQGGFDIPTGVDAPASGAAVTAGSGYAALTVGGSTQLYAIDLTTGAATAVGPVGNGLLPIQGLALQRDVDEGRPLIGLNEAGTSLARFSSTTPGVSSTSALTGLTAGESMVAVTWRPQTGQLLGLGVNAAADTGTLYLLDPQTGAAAPLVGGTASGVTWGGVDLPDPAVAGYGLDANPTVDRIRVTTGTTLNARINPITGVPVGADTVPSQPFGAVGYTNSYAGALAATLYAVDPVADQLVVVNPPNNGTATLPLAVTLAGAPLDFGPLVGFDIPEEVTVATSNLAATGSAYAALNVGGTDGLYTVDLANGQATSIGALAGALRSIAVGDAGANRPVVTPPPPPPPPPAPPATLTKAGAAKQQKKTVDTGRVLACPGDFQAASCSTRLTVTATYKVKVKGRTKVRSVVVGARAVKTIPGTSTRLKVTLSKKGVKLLKQRGRLAAKVAIVAPTGALAAKHTTTVKVRLVKKKL